jgi:hypothetical protein
MRNFSDNPYAHKRTTFAFTESQNGLEDVFGVTAAMVGAYMNSSMINVPATTVFTTTRIGSGSNWALVFAIPPLATALILAVQIYQWHLSSNRPWHDVDMEDIVKLEPRMEGSELGGRL